MSYSLRELLHCPITLYTITFNCARIQRGRDRIAQMEAHELVSIHRATKGHIESHMYAMSQTELICWRPNACVRSPRRRLIRQDMELYIPAGQGSMELQNIMSSRASYHPWLQPMGIRGRGPFAMSTWFFSGYHEMRLVSSIPIQ